MIVRIILIWRWLTTSKVALFLALAALASLGYQQWGLSNGDVLAAHLDHEGNPLLQPILLDRPAMLPTVPRADYLTIGARQYRDVFRGPWLAGKSSALVAISPDVKSVRMDQLARSGVPQREEEDFVYMVGEGNESRGLIGKSGFAYDLSGNLASDQEQPPKAASCKDLTWAIEGPSLALTRNKERTIVKLPESDTWVAVYAWESGSSCRGVLVGVGGKTLEYFPKTDNTGDWIPANKRSECKGITWSIESGSLSGLPDKQLSDSALRAPLEPSDHWSALKVWRAYSFRDGGECTGLLTSEKGRILQYFELEGGQPLWLDVMRVGAVSRTQWLSWLPAPWWMAATAFLLAVITVNLRTNRKSKVMSSDPVPTSVGPEAVESTEQDLTGVSEGSPIPKDAENPGHLDSDGVPKAEESAPKQPSEIGFRPLLVPLLAAFVLMTALVIGWLGPVESGAIHSSVEQTFWRSRVDGPYPVDQRITAVHHSGSVDPLYYFVAAGGEKGAIFLSDDLGATWRREETPVKFPVLAISLVTPEEITRPWVRQIFEFGDQHARAKTFSELRVAWSSGIVASRTWDGDWRTRILPKAPLPDKRLASATFLRSRDFPYAIGTDETGQKWCFNRSGWSKAPQNGNSGPPGANEAKCPEEGRHIDDWVAENAGSFYLPENAIAKNGTVVLFASDGNNQFNRGPAVHRFFVLQDTAVLGPSKRPPGWLFLLIIAASVGMFITGFRHLRPILAFSHNTISGIRRAGISDSPVNHPAEDELDFWARAESTAEHIMNPATSLPICLAVEGEWGTGKTSYMRLLQRQLVSRGCQSVWINPWHHKAEESFLAAVLDGVRRNGAPGLLTWRGLRYRAALLYLRWGWPWLLLLLGAAWLMWYRQPISMWITKLGGEIWDPLKTLVPAGLGAISLERLWSVLKFIRANPAADLLASSNGITSSALAEKLSLRHRASTELSEALNALSPGRLVIFFDDLDRCSATDLVACLETCNFLATAGPLVLVIGMSRRNVQSTLRSAFEQSAKSMDIPVDTYCQEYLKKIIQQRVEIGPVEHFDIQRVVCRRLAEPRASNLRTSFVRHELLKEWRWRRVYDPTFRWLVDAKELGRKLLFEGATISFGLAIAWLVFPGLQVFAPNAVRLSAPPHFAWASLTVFAVWIILRLVARTAFPPDHHEDGKAYELAAPLWADFLYQRSRNLRQVKRFVARVRFYASQHRLPLTEQEVLHLVAWSALEEAFPEHAVSGSTTWPPEGAKLSEPAQAALDKAVDCNRAGGCWPPRLPAPLTRKTKDTDAEKA